MNFYYSARKRNFPLQYGNYSSTASRRFPLTIPAVISLIFLQLSFTTAYAAATKQNVRQQVYARATAQVEADIKREAKNKGWRDYTVKMNVFIPNEVSSYKRCSTPLQVAFPGGNRQDFSRLRYDISCHDANDWSVSVTVKPDIYLPILVTKNTVERGEKLSVNDIQLKKHNVSKLRGAYLTDPDDVVGLTAKRRIRQLQPLSTSQLDMPILVSRGQKVIMIAGQDGIEARTIGEAMKSGRKGDLIQVRNMSSKRLVSAVVDQSGVVRMPSAMGNVN